MAQYLIVPIHLDALYLPNDRFLTAPSIDFTQLPYVDPATGEDVNSDTPYLSEVVLSKPFQDQNFRVRAGLHLHWALPDALTHATHQEEVTNFPLVPNRWLITCRTPDSNIQRQWVVESDYLSDMDNGGVPYPYIPDQMPEKPALPYQFLGRKLPVSAWNPDSPDRYLSQLTAVGYGNPAFAAFYPNCYSVFGFHDGRYTDSVPQGLQYELLGWYGDADQDELSKWIQSLQPTDDWKKSIEAEFAWTSADNATPPERMICYAQLTFATEENALSPLLNATETGVFVGMSATEALASHLGTVIPNTDRDSLENLLEAISFADELEEKTLDVGMKLREKRHANGFTTIQSGIIWQVQRIDDTSDGADVTDTQNRNEITLPPDVQVQLSELNAAQVDFDKASHEIISLREQIFADWYKYMVAIYPPETSREDYPKIDEIRFYIEKNINQLKRRLDETGKYPAIEYNILQSALSRLTQTLEAINTHADTKEVGSLFTLRATAAPFFYRPNEPVLLFTGDAATPSVRHGQDGVLHPEGLLECLLLNSAATLTTAAGLNTLLGEIRSQSGSLSMGIKTWTSQPWHPLFLQWEVEYFPSSGGNNILNGHFDPYFVDQNYVLKEEEVEFQPRSSTFQPDRGANAYVGMTILSATAAPALRARILSYLEKHILLPYYEANNIKPEDRAPDDFDKQLNTILDWYIASGDDDTLKTLINVYTHLDENEDSNLSQTLGGFNDALIMQKINPQTPIDDPIGFEDYQSFTQTLVREIVDNRMIHTPQPQNGFNPIRAGALRLLSLRLVDNFGITHDVDVNKIDTTSQLRMIGHEGWIALPPRLSQAAQLNFRWLSSSPVCGWILPNNLDDSLEFYDASGKALGALYSLPSPDNPAYARWEPEPGDTGVESVDAVSNIHLQKVIRQIQSNGADHVGNLLEAIDTALGNIDPDSYAQHRSQALLMGRPIAIVRAKLDLRLMGLPAVNQDWNVFRQDMKRNTRESDEFTHVRFPIRLGEHLQLNDGLVGYYEENNAFQLKNMFYAAQSDPTTDAHIMTYHAEPINIYQSIADPPHYLTLLMDPRGVVHATSGILPTKAIDIPSDQYKDALKNIEISFFSAPILADGNTLEIPLPQEAGFVWSWQQRIGNTWHETHSLSIIKKSVVDQKLQEGTWQQLIDQGWLELIDDQTAGIVASELRQPLTGDLADRLDDIEQVLDQATIESSKSTARFIVKPTMNEGWLKLRRLSKDESNA